MEHPGANGVFWMPDADDADLPNLESATTCLPDAFATDSVTSMALASWLRVTVKRQVGKFIVLAFCTIVSTLIPALASGFEYWTRRAGTVRNVRRPGYLGNVQSWAIPLTLISIS